MGSWETGLVHHKHELTEYDSLGLGYSCIYPGKLVSKVIIRVAVANHSEKGPRRE